jgi:hypothetical protein
MLYEHKKLNVTLELHEITQAQLEAWLKGLRDRASGEMSAHEYNGHMVREAARAGWIVNAAFDAEGVAALPPQVVRWYAGRISQHYQECITIPPE